MGAAVEGKSGYGGFVGLESGGYPDRRLSNLCGRRERRSWLSRPTMQGNIAAAGVGLLETRIPCAPSFLLFFFGAKKGHGARPSFR